MVSKTKPRLLIAIPVYNGGNIVFDCLHSVTLLRHTEFELDVIILDDASPVPNFSDQLAQRAAELGFSYYRSPRNLGIPRNFNLGLLYALEQEYDYVLLLNSDTIVSAGLAEVLCRVADSSNEIGSVTGWSNNVSIYSLRHEEFVASLADLNFLNEVGDCLAREFDSEYLEIPVGVGSCILIPVPIIREVGLMDPIFEKGYCEEVDWCLRAKQQGYRNVLAPGAFFFHQGGASTVQAGLLRPEYTTVPEHEHLIDLRYPNYRNDVANFMSSNELPTLMERSIRTLVRSANNVHGGYRLVVGYNAPSTDSRVTAVLQETSAGQPVLRIAYRGFMHEYSGSEEQLIGELIAIMGSEPTEIRVAQGATISPAYSEYIIKVGASVSPSVSYPMFAIPAVTNND